MVIGVDTAREKQACRERMWDQLERERVVPPQVAGRIPAFVGAEIAAARLAESPAWQAARTIKVVPDKPQFPVRERALAEGRLVYMAVPKLAARQPFYLLDPATLSVSPAEAASSKVAARVAPNVGVSDMKPVDLVVCGSVAVNRQGVRLGKGAGYSDLEVAILQEARLIGPDTLIATTVHSLQVVDGYLPEAEHDFSVDLIVTPDEVIECGPPRRPPGICWASLSAEKISEIPVLAAMAHRRKSNTSS